MEKCRLYLIDGVYKFIDEKGELCPLTETKARNFLIKKFHNTNFMSDETEETIKTFLKEKTNMIKTYKILWLGCVKHVVTNLKSLKRNS